MMGSGSSSGAVLSCGTCRAAHIATQCPICVASATLMEMVDYIGRGQRGQGNPYGTIYNEGWRNHPNFSCNSRHQQQRHAQPQGPQFQP